MATERSRAEIYKNFTEMRPLQDGGSEFLGGVETCLLYFGGKRAMNQKQNGPGNSANDGQERERKSHALYSSANPDAIPDIQSRLEGAANAGLLRADGRCVSDSYFGWEMPPDGFEFSDHAVHAILKNRYGELYNVKIAGRLWVSAIKRDSDGVEYSEISFHDHDGIQRRVDIRRTDYARPDDVVKILLGGGAVVDPTQARHITRYLSAGNPCTRLVKESPASKPLGETAKTICFADVAPEKISWLWFMIIALGKLSLLVGDPGLGKSLVTLVMAARTSLGGLWPDGSPCPIGNTIFITCEDDPADTIRPRLDAAGADVSKIHIVTAVCKADGKKKTFTLDNIPALEEAIIRIGNVKLIVIDPISAYMGGSDSHNNAEVRGVLAPLSELASKYKVAIVAVSHLNKGSGQAIYRAMGSLAFVAAARAVWAVLKDKDDPNRRLVLPIKNNIGNDTSGLAYRVATAANGAPCLEWEPGPVNVDVAWAMTPAMTSGGDSGERQEAKAWLIECLSNGGLPAKDIEREAKDAGFSLATLRRAKQDAGIKSVKASFGSGWIWTIPEDAHETSKALTPERVSILGKDEHLGEPVEVFEV